MGVSRLESSTNVSEEMTTKMSAASVLRFVTGRRSNIDVRGVQKRQVMGKTGDSER